MSAAASALPLATLVACAVGWVALTRLRLGAALSPPAVVLLVLASIYGVRPLYMLHDDSFFLYGASVRPGFGYASAVGLLAVLALLAGVAVSVLLRTREEGLAAPRQDDVDDVIRRTTVVALLALVVWVAVELVIGGGVAYLAQLFAGRSDTNREIQAGVPAIIDTLPMAAALLICLARLRVERVRPLLSVESACYWGIIAASVVPPTALGIRRYLLPTLVGVLLVAAARRWTGAIRPRWVVTGLVGFLVLSAIPFIRSQGSRTGSTSFLGALGEYITGTGVGGTLREFFVSYDTEMFSYVALAHQNRLDGFGLGLGRWLAEDFVLGFVPSSLSGSVSFSDQLLTWNFGGGCGSPVCPVPSLPGVLAADFGLVGVVLGMFVLGMLCTRFTPDRAFRMDGAAPVVFVIWCALPVIVRGNSVRLFSIYLQAALLVLVACHLLSIYRGADARSSTVKRTTVTT